MNARVSQLLIYISGILAMMLLTIVLIEVVMSPPLADLIFLVALLGITSLISAAFGFFSNRLGWWRRLPHIRQKLIIGYILAVLMLSLFTTILGGGLDWTLKGFLIGYGITAVFFAGMLAPLLICSNIK